jgi:hypothetical protein
MDKRIYLIDLYDIYSDLLSDKQREYFEYYYFDNLSLGEISDNLNVSRNAVHKQIKKVEEELNEYESKLKLYEKNNTLNKIINGLEDTKLKEELDKLRW